MEILGIGPLEFFLILLIALIVFGPQDMVKAGRTLGRFLRAIVMSDTWRMVQQVSNDLRKIPNRMIREAGIEDLSEDLNEIKSIQSDLKLKEINKELQEKTRVDVSDWITPPTSTGAHSQDAPEKSPNLNNPPTPPSDQDAAGDTSNDTSPVSNDSDSSGSESA